VTSLAGVIVMYASYVLCGCVGLVLYLHVYWDFPVSFVLLISSLILPWPESRHYVTSFHLNLLRCILWFQVWSVLVSASCPSVFAYYLYYPLEFLAC